MNFRLRLNLPSEVKTLLTWWYPRIQGILGASRIRSVIIGGGLTLRDFAPARSDVEIVMPTRNNLVSQLNVLLSRMTPPPLDRKDSAIWFAMKIFDIGRSVVFWRDGVLMSKTAAMKHEIDLEGPFTDSYRLALACREQCKAFAEVHLSDLSRCFESIREPAVDLLKQLSEQNDS